MSQHTNNRYYKYRSLQNLQRFIDIVIYHRLWSSTHEELNDPMEGVFRYNSDDSPFIQTLQKQKKKYLYLLFI